MILKVVIKNILNKYTFGLIKTILGEQNYELSETAQLECRLSNKLAFFLS